MASRVGDYLLFETLGKGAFGKVKLGVHEETGEQVAVKIMDKSDIKAKEMTMNVRREIAIMKALKHRNIVNLRQVLTSKTKLYIVMDLVTGGELFTKILSEGKLEEGFARKCFQQLIDGMEYCHKRGVCHRDLKPENLLIDETTGELKITDFGLSAMKGASTAEELLHTQCGSPNYCAPEIIAKHKQGYNGTKVDAWSCGVILFTLLAGYLPFYDEKTEVLYKQIQFDNVKFPRKFPEGARDLVVRLLHKNPEKRYSVSDCKTHPWFIINYEGDDSAGKQNGQNSTPVKRKRHRRRQSVDHEAQLKTSNFDKAEGKRRSKSGDAIPSETQAEASLKVNGQSNGPANDQDHDDAPPLPPIISAPPNPLPTPPVYHPLPVPRQTNVPPPYSDGPAPLGTMPKPYVEEYQGNPVAQRSSLLEHGRMQSGIGIPVSAAISAPQSEAIVRSTDVRRAADDLPPPYESVASGRMPSTAYGASGPFRTGVEPTSQTPPPLAYVPPENQPPSFPDYLPPPPPDYRPPADNLQGAVGNTQGTEEVSRVNSMTGSGIQFVPPPPPPPLPPPPMPVPPTGRGWKGDVSAYSESNGSVLRLEERTKIIDGPTRRTDAGSRVHVHPASLIEGGKNWRGGPEQDFALSSVTVNEGVASSEQGATSEVPYRETAPVLSTTPSASLFEKRRALFGESIVTASSTATLASKGVSESRPPIIPAPLPDVTMGPSRARADELRSESSFRTISSSFRALPSLERDFEELPISFSSPDAHSYPIPAQRGPYSSQQPEGQAVPGLSNIAHAPEEVLHQSNDVQVAEAGFESQGENISAEQTRLDEVSAGIESGFANLSVSGSDPTLPRDNSGSSESRPVFAFPAGAEHEASSNTVIIHDDDETVDVPDNDRESIRNLLKAEIHRFQRLFGPGSSDEFSRSDADQEVTRKFVMQAVETTRSWGLIITIDMFERMDTEADFSKSEVEGFGRLLDFWERHRSGVAALSGYGGRAQIISPELSCPLTQEEVRLVRGLIEKVAPDSIRSVGGMQIYKIDPQVDRITEYPLPDGHLVEKPTDEVVKSLPTDEEDPPSASKLQPGAVVEVTGEHAEGDDQTSNLQRNEKIPTPTDRVSVGPGIPQEAPRRLEITPSTVRDPFRPKMVALDPLTNSGTAVTKQEYLPPVESTLAANEAAAAAKFGATIPPNVEIKKSEEPSVPPRISNTSDGQRKKSDSSQRPRISDKSVDSSAPSRKSSGSTRKSSETKSPAAQKSYFGFRRFHGVYRKSPLQFKTQLRPERTLIEVGRILTGMGGKVLMKRGENKMKYEGQGRMVVSIVCTFENGWSTLTFKKGKRDRSKAEDKDYIKLFNQVHERFIKTVGVSNAAGSGS